MVGKTLCHFDMNFDLAIVEISSAVKGELSTGAMEVAANAQFYRGPLAGQRPSHQLSTICVFFWR